MGGAVPFLALILIIFQKVGPAGGCGRGRPVHPRPTKALINKTALALLLGVNIDYFSKCLRKNFQRIININAKKGTAPPPPPRGSYFLKNFA